MSNDLIVLKPDDLPLCPKHGIRIITDFFLGEDKQFYERGKCALCDRTYTFRIEDEDEHNN